MNIIEVEKFDTCNEASHAAAYAVLDKLSDHADKRILFLVSGGSSASVAASVASRLNINITNSVTLALIDERYGDVGHADSNWKLLTDSGIDAELFYRSTQVLDEGTTLESVAHSYSRKLSSFIEECDYTVALLGMGADSHIAGILPQASEQDFDKFLGEESVVGYKADDFERITVSARTLIRLDDIIVYACGEEKEHAVDTINDDLPAHEHPAQILRRAKNVYVYYGGSK